MTSPRVLPSPANTSTYGVSRTYSALATWEAATDTDLVAANAGEILDCFDDAASFDDFALLFGATTDATRYRLIRPAAGEGHDGTPNNGVFFSWTSVGSNDSFILDEQYSQFHDLIAKHAPNATSQEEVFDIRDSFHKFVGCIAIDCVNSGTGDILGFKLRGDNVIGVLCLAIGTEGHNFHMTGDAGFDERWYNCMSIDSSARGFNASGSADKMAKNCLASGNTTEDYDNSAGSWVSGSVNNASADSTADEGGLDSATAVVDATFNFVNAAGDDYHLATADTDALDAGADLSADSFFAFNEDIDEDVFNVWDIGFDEPQPAGAASVLRHRRSSPVLQRAFRM